MNLFDSPYYQIGVFSNKLTSPVAAIISFLFGFFSKSFITVLIGVAFAALIDTLIIDIWITKSSTGMYLKNQGTWWQYHYFMSFGASCIIGFLTFFWRSKRRRRKARLEEREKIKAYGEEINEETRNKNK